IHPFSDPLNFVFSKNRKSGLCMAYELPEPFTNVGAADAEQQWIQVETEVNYNNYRQELTNSEKMIRYLSYLGEFKLLRTHGVTVKDSRRGPLDTGQFSDAQ
ncbi:hypothetical protein STEG23_007699, partial [Scotinomys teguina]